MDNNDSITVWPVALPGVVSCQYDTMFPPGYARCWYSTDHTLQHHWLVDVHWHCLGTLFDGRGHWGDSQKLWQLFMYFFFSVGDTFNLIRGDTFLHVYHWMASVGTSCNYTIDSQIKLPCGLAGDVAGHTGVLRSITQFGHVDLQVAAAGQNTHSSRSLHKDETSFIIIFANISAKHITLL